jgi:hypothetical protein
MFKHKMLVLLNDIIPFLAVKCIISMPERGQAKSFVMLYYRTKHHYLFTSCTCLVKGEMFRWSVNSSFSVRAPHWAQSVTSTTTIRIMSQVFM